MGGVWVWGSVFIESTKPRTADQAFARIPSIVSEVRRTNDERESEKVLDAFLSPFRGIEAPFTMSTFTPFECLTAREARGKMASYAASSVQFLANGTETARATERRSPNCLGDGHLCERSIHVAQRLTNLTHRGIGANGVDDVEHRVRFAHVAIHFGFGFPGGG